MWQHGPTEQWFLRLINYTEFSILTRKRPKWKHVLIQTSGKLDKSALCQHFLNFTVIPDSILHRSNTWRNGQRSMICGQKEQKRDNRGDSPISRTLPCSNVNRVRDALPQLCGCCVAKDNGALSASLTPLYPTRSTTQHCSHANCNTRSYPHLTHFHHLRSQRKLPSVTSLMLLK